MEYLEIQKLLGELDLINAKYENIARSTGNNYNIFQALRIETKEVTLHSRIIADLLNPCGWHCMGSQFLSLFFQTLSIENTENLNRVVCTAEKNYGPIDNKKITGGNIDIILEGLKKPLVIENKIYAIDQKNQLLRYHNQLNENCDLYYLTLFGAEPSEESTGNSDLKVHLISYNHHILRWLEGCYQLSIERPLLRETLKQYINTIKHLTGQSMNNANDKEIFDFIEKNKKSLAALHGGMNSFIKNRLEKLVLEIVDEINKDTKLVSSMAETPGTFPHQGQLACHFKFGNAENKGVIFELKTFPEQLSLWTTGWRWDGKDTYGTNPDLIKILDEVNCYENQLNSRKSVQELVQEVKMGIVASKEYYEVLLNSKTM